MNILILVASIVVVWCSLILFAVYSLTGYRCHSLGYLLIGFFGLFVFSPYLLLSRQSYVEFIIGVPLSLIFMYVSYAILRHDFEPKRITRMISVSLAIAVIPYSINAVEESLIRLVANDVLWFIREIGYEAHINQKDGTYIVFDSGHKSLKSEIVLACTGVSAMSLVAGMISTVEKLSFYEKVILTAVSFSVIYLLNLIRNIFIAVSYGDQLFHVYPENVELLFGRGGEWVSYYIADKIVSQTASVAVISFILYIFLVMSPKFVEEVLELIDMIRDISLRVR